MKRNKFINLFSENIIGLLAALLLTAQASIYGQAQEWKTQYFPDLGISLNSPFTLTETKTDASFPNIDTMIAYGFSDDTNYFDIQAICWNYSVEPQMNLERIALLNTNGMRLAISNGKEVKDFNYKLISLFLSGKEGLKVYGGFNVDGVYVIFKILFWKEGKNIWQVHCLYYKMNDYHEISERIINSVKIENDQ